MNRSLSFILFYALMHASCYQAGTREKSPATKSRFVYKETIASGDTEMISLGSFKRSNIADILCQRWELENWEEITADRVPDVELRKSIPRDMVLFKDSTVVLNPVGKLRLGKWRLDIKGDSRLMTLSLSDKTQRQYVIMDLASNRFILSLPEVKDFFLNLYTSRLLHRNMYNDPFHPVNNRWRIKPLEKETDSAIYARLKNCLLFFALYFRDHIKRNTETISFEELPEIFAWYNRGIGLPDKDELSDSWIDCFYNKEEAQKGYSILRKLIVDFEYKWPSGAPGWTYETHSVLEQMYHKIDDIKK
jgi:hypothetical protein